MAVSSTSFKKGHQHTQEVVAKISATKKSSNLTAHNKGIKRGVNFSARNGCFKSCTVCCNFIWIEKNQNSRKKFCSKPCKCKGRNLKNTFKSGRLHPGYIDGRAGKEYPREFKQSLKTEIKKRDNYTCQLCGINEDEYRKKFNRGLCVNHIDFNKQNCDSDNLNILCVGCNSKINWDRPRWTAYFQLKMKEARNGESLLG